MKFARCLSFAFFIVIVIFCSFTHTSELQETNQNEATLKKRIYSISESISIATNGGTAVSVSQVSNYIINQFQPAFISKIPKISQWITAYGLYLTTLDMVRRMTGLPTDIRTSLVNYERQVMTCGGLCFGNITLLQSLATVTSPPAVSILWKATILLLGLQPMSCNSTRDYCTGGKLQLQSNITYPACSKSYCWFNPGKKCTPTILASGGSPVLSIKYATCQTREWFLNNSIECPVINCKHLNTTTSTRTHGWTRNVFSSKKSLAAKVQALLKRTNNRRQAACGTIIQCGDCQSDEVSQMDNCAGQDLNGVLMCCVCTLNSSVNYLW